MISVVHIEILPSSGYLTSTKAVLAKQLSHSFPVSSLPRRPHGRVQAFVFLDIMLRTR